MANYRDYNNYNYYNKINKSMMNINYKYYLGVVEGIEGIVTEYSQYLLSNYFILIYYVELDTQYDGRYRTMENNSFIWKVYVYGNMEFKNDKPYSFETMAQPGGGSNNNDPPICV